VAVYADAIRRAREAFDAAPAFGFNDMHLLDIGGGFTAPYDAASAALFYRTAAVINRCMPRRAGPGGAGRPGLGAGRGQAPPPSLAPPRVTLSTCWECTSRQAPCPPHACAC
jgi:hypothetical protein